MHKGKPSETARKVALSVVTLGTKEGLSDVLPASTVDVTAKLLVESGAVSQAAVRFARSRLAFGINLAFDWIMPGQFEAFADRRAFCERQVRKGIEAGAEQVLVLGAGYDTLCWRLAPEFANVAFFEIDHPATARLKAKGIKAMGRPTNLQLIAEDLGEKPLVDVLGAHPRWNTNASTVIVAEGFLMYLSPESVAALLRQCSAIAGVGSRIAFTYVGTRADGRPDAGPWSRLTLRLLKAIGEPWLWSMPPEQLGAFLIENEWETEANAREASQKCGVEFFGVAVK